MPAHPLLSDISHLIYLLQEPDWKLHLKQLEQLIKDNAMLTGHTDGFRHAGRIFSLLDPVEQAGASIGDLHGSLLDRLTLHLADAARLQRDTTALMQPMLLVLQDCRCQQDLRDALPEALIEISGYQLPRTRPEGWCASSLALQRVYAKLRDKIHYHLTLRLIS